MKFWRERLEELREKVSTKASRGAERVFNALVQHAKTPDGYAWPSIKTLREVTGMGRSTVFRNLRKLVDLGVIHRRGMVERERGRTIPTIYRLGREVEEVPARCKWNAVLDVEKPVAVRRNRNSPSESQQKSLENGARSQTWDGGRVPNAGRGRVPNVRRLEVIKRNKEKERGVGQSVSESGRKRRKKIAPMTENRKPQRKAFSFFSGPDRLTDLTKESSQEKKA